MEDSINRTYFYRKIAESEFMESASQKKIIFVRIKNKVRKENSIFNGELKTWETVEFLPEVAEDCIYEEFIDVPHKIKRPILRGNDFLSYGNGPFMEEFSPSEMHAYLDYRKQEACNRFYSYNLVDLNGVSKNYFAYEVICDDEKFSVTIKSYRFHREEKEPESEIPVTESENFTFDVKNGSFLCPVIENTIKKDTDMPSAAEVFKQTVCYLNFHEISFVPDCVISFARKKLYEYASKFTSLKLEEDTSIKLTGMFFLTLIPCEYKLAPVLMSRELEKLKFSFKIDRRDPQILKNFFKKACIKDYRALRRAYNSESKVLLTYKRLHDAGFTDLNLINRVIESTDNCEIIDSFDRKSLIHFSKYCIRQRGQIAALNLLLKTVEDDNDDYWVKNDGLRMFCRYFKYIPESLRRDVIADGFTRFNHDAISNISYQVQNKNITFSYSREQKALEDDIDGYEFRLPESSYHLCEIGTSLHNCVASYAENVSDGECTIVYARKNGTYKICIELRGKRIEQERMCYNEDPDEETKKILTIWHEKHSLAR